MPLSTVLLSWLMMSHAGVTARSSPVPGVVVCRRLSSKRYKLPVVIIMPIRVKHIPVVVIYNINAMQIKLISCADISEIWTFIFSSLIPNYSGRRHLSLTVFLYFVNIIYTSDYV